MNDCWIQSHAFKCRMCGRRVSTLISNKEVETMCMECWFSDWRDLILLVRDAEDGEWDARIGRWEE